MVIHEAMTHLIRGIHTIRDIIYGQYLGKWSTTKKGVRTIYGLSYWGGLGHIYGVLGRICVSGHSHELYVFLDTLRVENVWNECFGNSVQKG